MAEPTATRATLRRAVARRLKMPFARRVGDSGILTAATTTTQPRDVNRLVQTDDFWNSAYFFNVTRDASRLITDFANTNGVLTLEAAITAQVAGDVYEVHNIWSADDIHHAINSAIESGFPAFFDYVTDEVLVTEQDKMAFDLTTLTIPPWMISKVFIERASNVLRGAVTSAAAGSITATGLINQLSGVTSAWRVSIWTGTGAGQSRAVSSVNNLTGQVTITPNWTVTPDSTSQFSLWNPNIQRENWYQIVAGRPDQHEFPNTFYLADLFPSSYGMRLRLQYAARPLALTAEADTTVVPSEFIIDRALATMYEMMADDVRVDRARYASLSEYYATRAEAYRQSRAFRMPDGTLWQDTIQGGDVVDSADPLGWRRSY